LIVTEEPAKTLAELITQWRSGDQQAFDQLVPLLYSELRDLARFQLNRERPGHTLQSGALVHEAYLRLLGQTPYVEDRDHFLMLAARLMRQILVDHARTRLAAKRGAGQTVQLDPSLVLPQSRSIDVVALDDALHDLSRLDEQQGRIVELRFFGGLSIGEVAAALDISPATVKRDWAVAKVWLARQLKRGIDRNVEAATRG
jgi:RNA polymerase sigma factor (TIGR02999 family)